VEAITLAFEKLAAAEPVLAAELIKLLRGADISTLRELFGAPKQQQPTADNAPAPSPPPPRLEWTPDELREREERAARFRGQRRPIIEGSPWAS
jgi:hypothetical protein